MNKKIVKAEIISEEEFSKIKQVDIIIPVYKSRGTLFRTLSSIATQVDIDKIRVTLVNDCDGLDYSDIIGHFSSYMDVKELRLNVNSGPGVARQFGIDSTELPFITFMDSDDTLASPFSIRVLLKEMMKEEKNAIIIGNFGEEIKGNDTLPMVHHVNDFVWMFGKLYRRSFLNKFNIRFNESRSNEDNGFNGIAKMCLSEEDRLIFIQDTVYFWHFKEDSITRVNNGEYTFKDGFTGYNENMIYAVNRSLEVNPKNKKEIKKFAALLMVYIYLSFQELSQKSPENRDKAFESCVDFFEKVFVPLCYRDMIKNNYDFDDFISMKIAERADLLAKIKLEETFYSFIKKMRKAYLKRKKKQ
jgi:glycosyltransferase involved in cell wall biosynthesis